MSYQFYVHYGVREQLSLSNNNHSLALDEMSGQKEILSRLIVHKTYQTLYNISSESSATSPLDCDD